MAKRPGDGRRGEGRGGPPKGRGGGKKPAAGKGRGGGKKRGPAKGRGAKPGRAPDRRPARPRGPRPLVAVFARSPEPGRVKTRLMPALRPDEAADLYRALLLDTVEVVESAEAEAVIAFTPTTARRPLERLLGRRRRLLPQPPGELGDRLEGIQASLHGAGRPVLVVGSDCPGLTPDRLREAVAALERAPAVLGPALDGGFYLLGTSRPEPDLLRGIPWSTADVLEATRRRLRERGLEIRELPVERDLDTPRDLFEWFAVARESSRESAYPRTWKCLHSLMTPRRLAELQARLAESP